MAVQKYLRRINGKSRCRWYRQGSSSLERSDRLQRLGCLVITGQEITRKDETRKTNLIVNFVQNALVLQRSLSRDVEQDVDKLINEEGFAQTLHHSTQAPKLLEIFLDHAGLERGRAGGIKFLEEFGTKVRWSYLPNMHAFADSIESLPLCREEELFLTS